MLKIAIIGNYLPRQCGIATFTHNFVQSISLAASEVNEKADLFVVAVNDKNMKYDYPDIVHFKIRQNYRQDYLKAAQFINESGADICVLQHEYGIFGGESGVFILSLVHQLKMPVTVTFHTVLKAPTFHEKAILKKLGELASKVVVMSKLAIEFLKSIYHIPEEKISMIPHGVPDFSKLVNVGKSRLNSPGKTLMCTFGLIGRNKGIETVLNALPMVVAQNPDIVYVVLGKTHPNVKNCSGEEYREYLQALVKKNKLEDHVVFLDEFLEEEELKCYLLGVDIYLTPYLNEAQITSGTLAYALGSGTCVVSTPYWHARELLAEGRGKLFDFGDCNLLAEILIDLLENPLKIKKMSKTAFDYGLKMRWDKVGRMYLNIFESVAYLSLHRQKEWKCDHTQLPDFNLDHIKRLTDDIGILEHSIYSIANLIEGYSLDDNARALLMALMLHESGKDPIALDLAGIYMRYIQLMQKTDGSFHNELGYDRVFMDSTGSEDSFGRTIWALGYMIMRAPTDGYLQFAKDKFFNALPHFEKLQSNRGLANTIIGLCYFLRRYPDNEMVMKILYALTLRIKEHYYDESDEDWKWVEPILCYDNAIVPLSLWHSYTVTRDPETLQIARETTAFLEKEGIIEGHLSLVGNDSWYIKGEKRPRFGQLPINAMAMVMMFHKAYQVTRDEKFYQKMFISFSWFTGNNDMHISLIDEDSQGCSDGIKQHNVKAIHPIG
ncbi:MAG: glycosyltransferase family 4 protein [Bacteroidetes bacterium]|nr:glycosyltransferase family 4 protein [Bacteroidota bacterium]